ncbi:FolC bifunctional protein [Guyanagaster necrorhizus]|uniref:FolC bifunctional protein n=1 Tax=Guyanagaster necrorhizus TaxID=856835 RepID=A0A9P7VL53_9AGAR|nr:FolC bifunctional protein [Guyanagaster necrorhizus MCA 3950]KAG7443143.1 FolC bifunctional protein [Guyanagaster necrorhizus MCA 3950]
MSIDLTLDRIRNLSHHLPPYTRPTIHVAGTNGKGSVAAFVSSILSASDPPSSVGRFNSPHLVSVHDSIVIGGRKITPEVYSAASTLVEATSKEYDLPISSFEKLTLTALIIFEQARVDFVVLEVGMGGRLDATNIIPDESILLSALAAVDLDHQAFLGTTIAAIANEKAAIARKGKPFVLGYQAHDEVERVAREVVASVDGIVFGALPVSVRPWNASADGPEPPSFSISPAWHSPPPLPVRAYIPALSQDILARLPLHGDHQLQNLGLALGVVDTLISQHLIPPDRLTPATIAEGIKQTKWPGRLSFHSVNLDGQELPVLVDGAHNPASSESLARYLTYLVSSLKSTEQCIAITYILALSHSPPKRPRETLAPLFSIAGPLRFRVAVVSFSPPEGMPWVKMEDSLVMKETVRSLSPDVVICEGDRGLLDALKWANELSGNGLIVLAGSLYLVADFYRLFKKI